VQAVPNNIVKAVARARADRGVFLVMRSGAG
jgi:hypothetical protein